MPSPRLPSRALLRLRDLWTLPSVSYSLRVAIALSTLMAGCWFLGRMPLVMPLFLGVVASALSETDDNWRGRLQALALTLACFAGAAVTVRLVYAQPPLFALLLVAASFGLTMLGAISPRYQAIGYGTLILSIYTAIGVDHGGAASQSFWLEPLLLAGAAWYGLLSVLWCALFLHPPVQQNLAEVWRELAEYLRIKATLFEPVRGMDRDMRRITLARQSGRVVVALNQAKESIFNRVDARRASSRMRHYLQLYFIAQDVHERAGSSHYPYEALAGAFFHSDVLFRCLRLLQAQARDCDRLAVAVLRGQPFEKSPAGTQALEDLGAALAHVRAEDDARWRTLGPSLSALARNLGTLDTQLERATAPEAEPARGDGALFDRSPRSWRDAWGRVRAQLTLASPLLRHALRLGLALAAGYGLMHLIHASQGYWIVLTTLFVCQSSYGATRKRMGQRVSGTFLGLLAGWAVFQLFPQLWVQAMASVVAGVVFFIARTRRYRLATASMTLLVLLSFNQVGDGYGLIVPRMVDTLLGSLVAGLAVFFILPDWRRRRVDALAARSLGALAVYLRAIMRQYREGQRDDLDYRLARRNAHNADAALSTALSNMMDEPGFAQAEGERTLRLLLRTHTMLNYLSGLGAHRQRITPESDAAALCACAETVAAALDTRAQLFAALGAGTTPPPGPDHPPALPAPAWPALTDDEDTANARLVAGQLQQVWTQVQLLTAPPATASAA